MPLRINEKSQKLLYTINYNFARRHNGPFSDETQNMLEKIGADSIDRLIDQTVPSTIQMKEPMNYPKA
ncbi:MAG: hypothetical protein WCI71_02560 [Bacteroidota bacterium]